MGSVSVMVKPASASCNLRCHYCFYSDVSKNRAVATYGAMDDDVAELLVERLVEATGGTGDVHVSFQGGEPTLVGLAWFERFLALTKRYPGVRMHWSLQTNATLLDRAWATFLARNDFLVGISLDGPEQATDAFRLDPSGVGVYGRVMEGVEILRSAGVSFNVLTVITRQLALRPHQLLRFYLDNGFSDVQLIGCLPVLDGADDGMSLRPEDYRSFFTEFFFAWQKAAYQGHVVRVNLFENLLGMLLGHAPYQCGMLGQCSVQLVVESNGDVYPCDFYCLDEHRLGSIRDSSLHDLMCGNVARTFLAGGACRRLPCVTCPYARICNGGCRRQNVCYLTDDGCAYQEVLSDVLPALARMVADDA